MTTTQQVTENNRRARYSVQTEGQAIFELTFPVQKNTDVSVYLNASNDPVDPAEYGVDVDSGNVVFSVGRHIGDIVVLEGNKPIERDTGYALRAPLQSAAVNADLNGIVYMLQEMRRDIDRAIVFAKTQGTGTSNMLPPLVAGAVLVMREDGIGAGPTVLDLENAAVYAAETHEFRDQAEAFAAEARDYAPASFASGDYDAVADGETEITVSQAVTVAGAIEVYRRNVRQQPGIDYLANGSHQITLTTPTEAGESFWWVHGGGSTANYLGENAVLVGTTTNEGEIVGGAIRGLNEPLALASGGTGGATAADARTALELVVGTDVQGYHSNLTALGGVTLAADKLVYASGASSFATSNLTAFGRSLIDDTNAVGGRTTLGLGTAATANTGTSGAGVVPTLDGASTFTGDNIMSGANRIFFNSGSAGTPGLRWYSEQNSGVFRPAAGTIGFAIGGTEVLRATASGLAMQAVTGVFAGFNTFKAFVAFDQTGTLTVYDSFNVSSVTDSGVGWATVNFTVPMADTNYTILTGGNETLSTSYRQVVAPYNNKTVNGFGIATVNTSTGALTDFDHIFAGVIGR